jgi:KDO2-lipid IV(A) lauroyltransferase
MIDQRVREGINVPFFKKPCSTTSIPAQIVKKYDCEIVPIYIERKKGYHFEMTILQPMIFDKNSSVEMITTRLNETLEQMILKNVDQWIWTHNRWQK